MTPEEVSVLLDMRREFHLFASNLTEFLEVARESEADPDDWQKFLEDPTWRHYGHPNVLGYLHNSEICSDSLDRIIYDLDLFSRRGLLHEPIGAIREQLEGILKRWGWVGLFDRYEVPFDIDDPAVTLTPEEYRDLSRSLTALEIHTAFLGLCADSYTVPGDAPGSEKIVVDTDALFFRSFRFFDEAGFQRLSAVLEGRDEPPVVLDAIRHKVFRESFGIGREGRHPAAERVFAIKDDLDAFLRAVELGIPVEGDDGCLASTPGFPWLDGEFYACQAASRLCDSLHGEDGQRGDTCASGAYGWNTEIHIGLRWLVGQMEDLLDRWDFITWEDRLKDLPAEPTRRATISPAELAALRRTADLIARGIKGFGAERPGAVGPAAEGSQDTGTPSYPPASAESGGATKAGRERPPFKKSRIIATFYANRDLSDREIAEMTGSDRSHVFKVLRHIRQRLDGQMRRDLPRGSKGRDGEIEAWVEGA